MMSFKPRLSRLGLAVLFWGSVSFCLQNTAHRHRNKNWCAFIVQRNVSCAVRAHTPALVEAEAAPCAPQQPDCEPSLTYQTHFRPTYKISYKTVTELEWRCCPGYQGPDCKELKGSPNRQIIFQPQPSPQSHPGYTQNTQRRRGTEQHNGHHDGAEKTRQLEEEVQRLSQTVSDLQAAMTSMTANLRTDLQEDTSKMLVTLLNNMRLPDSARTEGAEESTVHLDGHQAIRGLSHEEKSMEEVLARLTDVADALKSKDEAIEELRDAVTGHDGQIRMLMDASQGPAVTASAASDIDILQTYIDTKFDKLKKELVVDMKVQMAKLKTACDDKILSLQKTCKEDQERNYDNLTKLVDNKEAELRKEIRELRLDMAMSDGLVRTHRQTAQLKVDDGDLRKTLQRVLEAHQVLNVRMDNELKHLSMLKLEDVFGPRLDELEARMNVTERNAEAYCFYVDEKLTKNLADETKEIRELLEHRLSSMEDQFTVMLIEMSNNSFPGMFSESVDALQTQVNSNKHVIQGLEDKLSTIGEICSSGCKSSLSVDPQNLGGLEIISKDLRHYRNDMDVLNTDVENNAVKLVELEGIIDRLGLKNQQNTDSIQDIQSKLNPLADNVSGLTGAVTGLGDAMSKFSQDLETLNSSCCLIGHEGLVQRPSTEPPLSHRDKPSLSEVEDLKNRLERLNSEVAAQLSLCKENTATVAESIASVDSRIVTLEKLCGKLDDNRNQLQDTKEGLENDLAKMNSTLQTQFREISNLQRNMLNFQSQLATLKTSTTNQQGVPVKQENSQDPRMSAPPRKTYPQQIHIPLIIPQRTMPPTSVRQPRVQPSNPRQHYVPLQPTNPRQPHAPMQPTNPRLQPYRPVLMSGEAGPPGFTHRVTTRRDHGTYDSGKPINGFAGAPGYPSVNPVSYKPNPVAVSQVPWSPAQRLFATQASERNLFVEPFSFSAGLTEQTLSGDFGIIRFNRVLVNDGGHYNPDSGIFTVPVNGRYLVSAVLTAPRRERLEAVLSVSERSVQKLDSAGFGGHGEQVASRPCQCGSSVTFSLVLSLRAGDRVALVRTAGTLAVSEAREILSTFSAVFLYSPQSHR